MVSHSVTCHPAAVTFPPLSQPKLVLDLSTPEGCKAELIWVVLISQDSLQRNTVTYFRNNWKVSWLGIELTTESHKSNVLTTTPPRRLCAAILCLTNVFTTVINIIIILIIIKRKNSKNPMYLLSK